ncbi:MAG: acyltransferase [Pseudolysinimonas sp.]
MSDTISHRFHPRDNSLNALRLLLASLVIVSHSWPLTLQDFEPHFGGANLGTWAVLGFFAISGFLITRSRLRVRRTRDFYRARALRILPAFVVALLVVAFVFAPLSQLVDPTASWQPLSSVEYVVRNLPLYPAFVAQPGIDVTLTTNVYPIVWDGPLWTLFWEGICYLAVGILVSVLPRKAVPAVVVVLLVGLTAVSLAGSLGVVNLPQLPTLVIPMILAFLGGSVLFLFAERVPAGPVAVAVAVVVLAGITVIGQGPALAALPLAFLLVWLGCVLPLSRVGSKYDVSYGIYIYAWPVQQFLTLTVGPDFPIVLDLLIVFAVTVPLAFASCVLIERPFLARKASAPLETPQEAPFP